jgi:WD40 repeat protein
MRLIDFETGKVLQIFGGHTGAVRAVAFSFDGKFVASCCEDNKVRLFNIVAP